MKGKSFFFQLNSFLRHVGSFSFCDLMQLFPLNLNKVEVKAVRSSSIFLLWAQGRASMFLSSTLICHSHVSFQWTPRKPCCFSLSALIKTILYCSDIVAMLRIQFCLHGVFLFYLFIFYFNLWIDRVLLWYLLCFVFLSVNAVRQKCIYLIWRSKSVLDFCFSLSEGLCVTKDSEQKKTTKKPPLFC